MDVIQHYFLIVFSKIYPLIHTHLVSYLLILGTNLLLIKLTWKKITSTGGKNSGSIILKMLLFGIEGILILYAVWFIFIHFHTFRLLQAAGH
jgi:hypothetical protein